MTEAIHAWPRALNRVFRLENDFTESRIVHVLGLALVPESHFRFPKAKNATEVRCEMEEQ